MAGIVVAPQPLAAEAGAEALRRGGNAFDAAVAAAFMQAATDPFMCGIGGMGVATVHAAATGETLVLDFYARAGSRARPELWADRVRTADNGKTYVEGFTNDIGYTSILVPGTVAGLGALHRRWGRLPWGELVEPAARRLRAGYPLFAYIADYFHYPFGPHSAGIDQRIRATEAMARIWLRPDGSLPQVGEAHRNPDYAATLERIAADGPDTFYRGALGERIAEDFDRNGALVTAGDLAGYEPRWGEPVEVRFRDVVIRSNPAPGGGLTVLEVIRILEGYPLQRLGHNTPEYLHLLASALKAAFADRKACVGDPAFVDVPVPRLLSDEHAAAWREAIAAGRVGEVAAQPAPGTTHLTVADDDGNVVAVTHTLGSGSGVVTPGLGFQYNNAANQFDPVPGRPNSMAPGKARLTGMAPTLVFRGGQPLLALGSPGSNAIISAVIQVILNVVEFGMTPVEAVSAPRIHCEGAEVVCETRIPGATLAELERRGHRVAVRPYAYDTLQGRVQLVAAAELAGAATPRSARWTGASDPRRDGGIALVV